MNLHVIKAIFGRNFVSYFSNPTGYAFICVFVLLSSFAAFWPEDFFANNLANLDQLNKYLPFILLVFIPAITMSIWADERRQGTDELLLTIPAADFDVVLGKYLAALAIYSVSLLFSLLCNLIVLNFLTFPDSPDAGLFLCTYFGYWMVGVAMLAMGMVASFLTGNLTVGFILGAIFNLPVIFMAYADQAPWPQWIVKKHPDWILMLKGLSISEQFRDFSHGVVSFAGVGYFLAMLALMLYLSMVLIGRRHWRGGQEGRILAFHYLARFCSLLMVVVGVSFFLTRHDRLRLDLTSERLNTLSPQTVDLLKSLKPEHMLQIHVYVSPNVPEDYAPTRLNLLNTLREFEALIPDKMALHVHQIEPLTTEAALAERQFNIKPQAVDTRKRTSREPPQIFLGAAFSCGLEKEVVQFFQPGLPLEYELARSVAIVTQQKRKKIGVLSTDAKLYGSFDMQTFQPTENQALIDELQKQYELVKVDAASPITEKFDALLAVQPSSLGPEQMKNFIAAVKRGLPTAIFEDPLPAFFMRDGLAGTMAPKQPQGGNPFQQRMPPQPKGDIRPLWKLLGIDFDGANIVWQDYNPHPKLARFLTHHWVFVGAGSGAKQAFNDQEPISSKFQEMILPFPGSLSEVSKGKKPKDLKFTALISTGEKNTGTVPWNAVFEQSQFGPSRFNPDPGKEERMNKPFVLAAHIQGTIKTDSAPISDNAHPHDALMAGDDDEFPSEDPFAKAAHAGAGDATDDSASPADEPKSKETKINVVVVADVDCLSSDFFGLRDRGGKLGDDLELQCDNVPFVLNVLDALAGDQRFIDIRKRRPSHRTLTSISDRRKAADERESDARKKFDEEQSEKEEKERKVFTDKIDAIQKELQKSGEKGRPQALQKVAIAKRDADLHMQTQIETLKQERDRNLKEIQTQLSGEIREVQDRYKMWAVLLPPIPPLLVALAVFFSRRASEREGVNKARLR